MAVGAGSFFVLVGLGVAILGGGASLAGVLAAYLGLSVAYMFVLRDIALLDLAAIAGGFLLRAVAGGVAADVELSMWFLMVAGFGSLFLAAGKRRAEYFELGDERTQHRRSLHEYSESYLRYVQYASSTVAIAAYAQWAFEGPTGGTIWSELSIVPFVLGIFRYALLIDGGRGAAPEDRGAQRPAPPRDRRGVGPPGGDRRLPVSRRPLVAGKWWRVSDVGSGRLVDLP